MNPSMASDPDSANPSPVTIWGDNQRAILLAKNLVFHPRTKHIHISHHYCREKMETEEIALEYIPTDLQVADVLTKALPGPAFTTFRRGLGLES